ncbi:MAG: phosphate acyltransferase PlsX [Acidimicrobiales bacterium]
MKPIAIDLMGGDNAPSVVIEAMVRLSDEDKIPMIAVGTEEALAKTEGIGSIVDRVVATEIIAMDDDPASSVRRKRDSSLVRCAELVRDGAASGTFSAGNTGAAMAAALFKMGRIRGLTRPAIATTIPVPGGLPTVLLDSGANAECTAQWLVQFAVMGSIFFQDRFGVESPRVGLLSIGEEETKGSPLVKETYELLRDDKRINFIGNVEGRDVMTDLVDVVVTDGFTGNVVLKTLEGATKTFARSVLEHLGSGDDGQAVLDLALPKLLPLVDHLRADAHGGGVLLGVRGLCMIGHGSSTPEGIYNAVHMTAGLVEMDLVHALEAALNLGSGEE